MPPTESASRAGASSDGARPPAACRTATTGWSARTTRRRWQGRWEARERPLREDEAAAGRTLAAAARTLLLRRGIIGRRFVRRRLVRGHLIGRRLIRGRLVRRGFVRRRLICGRLVRRGLVRRG